MSGSPEPVHESPDLFSRRLAEAIEHLDDQQKDLIQSAMDERGLTGGIKGGLAQLAGMKVPSMLSDILAGRARGHRYRADLARWVGVDVSWLEGGDRQAPEWALSPLEAYERWLKGLRIAWQAWFLDRRGQMGPGVTTLGIPLGTDSRFGDRGLADEDRRALSEHLDLDIDDPALERLSHGSWELVPFDLLLAVAEEMKAPAPRDVEHIRRGHAIAAAAASDAGESDRRTFEHHLRYALPPRLFRLTRLALVSLRQQREYQGKDIEEATDALELLWRQQFQVAERDLADVPAEFTAETGRHQWTALAELRARYPEGDAVFDTRYESLRGNEVTPLKGPRQGE